jgi:hypothetical protein
MNAIDLLKANIAEDPSLCGTFIGVFLRRRIVTVITTALSRAIKPRLPFHPRSGGRNASRIERPQP